MNISQLRAFVTVVDRGSFSEAARDLGISQPAVTMQVQSLESALGVLLLERRYRRVDLTEAGQAVLPHARRVLEQLEQAKSDLERLSGAVTGRLTIAASTTPGVYVVPRLLGSFTAAYPEVAVSVVVTDTAQVIDAVESGSAQIGITGATVRAARVQFERLGRDELLLVARPDSPLTGRQRIPLSELCDEQWVLRESGSGTRQVSEALLSDHGLDPAELRVAVELGTGEAIVSAVEGGLGVSIVSRFVADKALQLGTIAAVDALGLPLERPFFSVMPKGNPTRAALCFHDHLVTHLAE